MSEERYSTWKIWKMRRYVVAILSLLGFCNSYIMRVNLSIAIVAMTTNRTIVNAGVDVIEEKEFSWDSKEQGLLLSSFFYGYISTNFIGGLLNSKFGGKRLFGIGIGVTGLLTLATPYAATTSFYLLLSVRILEGIFEGVVYTSVHEIWSRWAPPLERSKFVSISFSGAYIGTVISMPLCAYLSQWLGWRSIFYFSGGMAMLWLVCWWMFVTGTPDEDPFITTAELTYIKSALEAENFCKNTKHPWKHILTSTPVLACIFAHFPENWGFYTMLTQLPTFMKDVLHFDLGETGITSAMPYLAMALILPTSGYLADFLRSRSILTTTQARKIFCCCGFLAEAVLLLLAGYFQSPMETTICLTLGVGMGALSFSGLSANYLDIAPQHASVILGFSNTFATLPGMISPMLTGYIVKTGSAAEWRLVFLIASVIYVTGAILYGLMASGELQPWAKKTEPPTLLTVEFSDRSITTIK